MASIFYKSHSKLLSFIMCEMVESLKWEINHGRCLQVSLDLFSFFALVLFNPDAFKSRQTLELMHLNVSRLCNQFKIRTPENSRFKD